METQCASDWQLPGQEAEAEPHRYGAQEGLPGAPPVIRQVPSTRAPVATEQASQAPAQAVLQHTPSTQLPLRHWLAPPQDCPSSLRGRQLPPSHQWPDAQAASLPQLTGQLRLAPEHTYGLQEGLPGFPLASCSQSPAALQASHPRGQLELQHAPATQAPEAHCESSEQLWPFARSGVHWLP